MPLLAFAIELIGDRLRVWVQLDNGPYSRPASVDRLNASSIKLDQLVRSPPAGLQPVRQLRYAKFIQFEGRNGRGRQRRPGQAANERASTLAHVLQLPTQFGIVRTRPGRE
jgi:hypothetical protein